MLTDLTGLAPLDRRRAVLAHAITPALCELPPMPSEAAARQMLLTIAGVESGCLHRRQVPVAHAMGLWQFERLGGVAGVLQHRATAAHAAEGAGARRRACRYPRPPAAADRPCAAPQRPGRGPCGLPADVAAREAVQRGKVGGELAAGGGGHRGVTRRA